MARHILRIDVSPDPERSVTRRLAAAVTERLAPEVVTLRDLAAEPVPHIDAAWLAARSKAPEERNSEETAALALSDRLIAEIEAADTLVIGVPVWNFSVPAALKAWIDQVCRAGVTFRYSPEGPQGLLLGKRAILAVASGGTAAGSEADFATSYMRHVLGFIGIHDVEMITADRMALDPEATLRAATEQVRNLAA